MKGRSNTMARTPKFEAPQVNPYTAQEQPQTQPQEQRKAFYRFNAKLPAECKDFLQEMAWRKTLEEHRNVTITEYLTRLVLADMEAHPEWKDTIDTLNT